MKTNNYPMLLDRNYLINVAKELDIKIDKRQTTENIYTAILDELPELYWE